MTKATSEQAGRYVLDGSDEDLRRLLSISEVIAAVRSAIRGMEVPMRLLKWLGRQLRKHPLVSGIYVFAAAVAAPSLAATALPRHAKAIEHVGGTVMEGGWCGW